MMKVIPTIEHDRWQMESNHKKLIEKEVQKMVEADIIILAPFACSFTVVDASKKYSKPRFCVNYRTLNRLIKADRWSLPKLEEIFDELQGSVVFRTIDVLSGYRKIKMEDTWKEMETFVTRPVTYQFEVISFVLVNGLATLQRIMDEILGKIFFARAYLDDVIFSRSLPENIDHLEEIL